MRLVEVLKSASAPILPVLQQAFVYGSIAKGSEHAGSDVDVMLIGEGLSYSEVMQLLEEAMSTKRFCRLGQVFHSE